MIKLLVLCLCISPLALTAAADDNNISKNAKIGQFYFFHGQRALQDGNFEQARLLLQKSAGLSYPEAIIALSRLQEVFAAYNQQPGPRKVIVKRSEQ